MKCSICFAVACLVSLAWSMPSFGQPAADPVEPTAEQPATSQPPADQAAVEKPLYTARMLLLKADWSDVPAAKEINAELRAALKEASIPKELLDELPASGPKILFAQEIASFYSRESLAQLVAWLVAKGLVVKIEPLDPPVKGPNRDEAGRPHMPNHLTIIRKPLDFIDLAPPPAVEEQPFVSRRFALQWNLASPQVGQSFHITREINLVAKRRGAPAESQETLDRRSISFTLPDDQVVLINAFPARSEELLREAARRKGFEAVLFVARGDTPLPLSAAEPRLQLPERVIAVVSERQVEGSWPASGGRTGRGRMSPQENPRPKSAPKSELPDDVDASLKATKIFSLKNAKAVLLTEILKQLFPSKLLNAAADERTNSLIVNGPEETLLRVEAIVLKLDEAFERETPTPPSPPSSQPLDRKSAAQLYEKTEQEVQAAAKELREILRQQNPAKRSEAQLKELRDGVRAKVAAAFEARQSLLQAELTEINAELRDAEASIARRRKISQEIIDQRLHHLLNPDRPQVSPLGLKVPAPITPPGTLSSPPQTSRPGGRTSPPRPQPEQSEDRVNIADSGTNGPRQGVEVDRQDIGTPEALRRNLEDAERSLRGPEDLAQKALNLLRQSKPDAKFEELEKREPKIWDELMRRRRQRQFALDQLGAQIRLLQLEVDEAESALQAAKNDLELAESRVKAAIEPTSTLVARQQAIRQAHFRIERSRVMLSLYQKIESAHSTPAP